MTQGQYPAHMPVAARMIKAIEDNLAGDVKEFLSHGAGPSMRDSYGRVPLIIASGLGRTEIVTLLLDHGADVGARSSAGWTALIAAVSSGHEKVVGALLDHGADVDAVDDSGDTALIHAAHNGYVFPTQHLLNHGAAIDIKGYGGKTALDVAIEKERNFIVIMIEKERADRQGADQGKDRTLENRSQRIIDDTQQAVRAAAKKRPKPAFKRP